MPTRPLLPKAVWTQSVSPLPINTYPKGIQALIRRLRTPKQIQRWISSLGYNPTNTMRTLVGVARTKKAHCLEAVLAAATILEYHGYPPLILDLESADLLDHTLFLYRLKGKYGTVGMSRDLGLAGRKPVYRTIRSLVLSYAAPYIDHKAALQRYGVLDLRTLKRGDWRSSRHDVWFVEHALRIIPHRRIRLSPGYLRRWRQKYVTAKKLRPEKLRSLYPNRHNWADSGF